jgi:hypothetical protein
MDVKSDDLPERALLLVLWKNEEPSNVLRTDGLPVEDEKEGHSIRLAQIVRDLSPLKLAKLPVAFFNSVNENPAQAQAAIRSRVETVRAAYAADIRMSAKVIMDPGNWTTDIQNGAIQKGADRWDGRGRPTRGSSRRRWRWRL